MGKPFFVYLLICADGAYYTGHTDDLDRRVAQHQEGGYCAFTSLRRPVQLVWCEETQTRDEAKALELQIKHWSRAKKAALIRGDFAAIRQAAKKRFTSREQ
jgi:predicted GIY-YIG superfamily endonuclease